MCGIAGFIDFNKEIVASDALKNMTDIMRHRGPDDEGQYIKDNVYLGHRRLSIIDLSMDGHQPMSNEDGTIWIVFNGEIYNYKDLNKILQSKGHIIRSGCDTETIVHLYEEYGEDCVNYLRGMFSFAIWDESKKQLFAAVDRMRIKPFYYTVNDEFFMFASELKVFAENNLRKWELNSEAIHHYLSLQAVPVPQTIYQDIYTLPGGYCLRVKDANVKSRKYWDITFQPGEEISEEYYSKKLREKLHESVEMRLMSDVPLGAFLSGGVDSTTIVALMSSMVDKPIRTFSLGYNVGGEAYDDTYYAGLVAKKFNTNHIQKIISGNDILNELYNYIMFLDEPSSDAINSYFVSKLAAEHVTVVLCGQGGDELFAGYRSFDLLLKLSERDKKWERLPGFLRNSIGKMFSNLPEQFNNFSLVQKMNMFLANYGSFVNKYGHIRMELSEREKYELYTDTFRDKMNGTTSLAIYESYFNNINNGIHPINQVSYMDLKVHLQDVLLRDVDVMSMAFSLETRVPLIDHELVEFAGTIPPAMKIKNGRKKHIFLESVKDILPEEVTTRKKLGFNFPIAIWMRNELKPLIEFVLSKEAVENRGIFKYEAIEKIKNEFFEQNTRYRKLWALVVLELWIRLAYEKDTNFHHKLEPYLYANK